MGRFVAPNGGLEYDNLVGLKVRNTKIDLFRRLGNTKWLFPYLTGVQTRGGARMNLVYGFRDSVGVIMMVMKDSYIPPVDLRRG